MRNLNDEEIFETWLTDGLPDGLSLDNDEDFEDFTDNVTFADIMDTFIHVMIQACPTLNVAEMRRGVLYCDGVINEMSF